MRLLTFATVSLYSNEFIYSSQAPLGERKFPGEGQTDFSYQNLHILLNLKEVYQSDKLSIEEFVE